MKPFRRITAVLLTLALLLTLAVVPAAAAELIASGPCGANLIWELTDDGVLRIFGTGAMDDILCTNPISFESVKGRVYTAVIEEGVTYVGIQAFRNTGFMTRVQLPSTMRTLASGSFLNCYHLDNLYIPANIRQIGANAFSGCCFLKHIWFEGDAPEMHSQVFLDTNPITAYYPANNPTWTADKLLDYGSSITWIPYDPDKWDGRITEFGRIGGNIHWALDSNGQLRIWGQGDMEDPDNSGFSWKNIPDQIQRIVIEPGVTSISANAIRAMTQLTEISLPDSLVRIDKQAFAECPQLREISLPDSVEHIGVSAFFDCTQLTKVSLSDSLESIGSQAFAKCGQLTEVSLPASLQSLGKNAFAGSGITSVTLKPGNEYLRCIDNVVYPADMSEILSMPGIYSGHYVLPETVTELHENVFALQPSLTGVTLHDGVTYIDAVAFWNCTALTGITIPASVLEIGQYAFRDCPALKTIRFEGDAPMIASNAFYGLVPDVYHPADRESWEYAAWWDYSGTPNWIPYESSTLPAQVTSGSCGDGVTWNLDEEGILTISGSGAIRDYESPVDTPWHPLGRKVNHLVVSDGITAIGSNAFAGLVNLDAVTLPDSLESIGEKAFYCCGQTSVTIPAGVTRIGDQALRHCRYLSVIEFLGSAPQMRNDIFENMTATVYYPGGDPTWTAEKRQDYGGGITWEAQGQAAVPGDVNGNGGVDSDDAVYLLYHTLFGSDLYPLAGGCDFDGSGSIDSDDAIYLLYHTLFGDGLYPLH